VGHLQGSPGAVRVFGFVRDSAVAGKEQAAGPGVDSAVGLGQLLVRRVTHLKY
jgi:hypothetical protein